LFSIFRFDRERKIINFIELRFIWFDSLKELLFDKNFEVIGVNFDSQKLSVEFVDAFHELLDVGLALRTSLLFLLTTDLSSKQFFRTSKIFSLWIAFITLVCGQSVAIIIQK
jgi:hypothetical protein